MLLLTKNEGNLLQDFIWHSEQISGGNAAKPGAPIDKNTAQQHGNEALDGLRSLGTLIISNGEFRKLCMLSLYPHPLGWLHPRPFSFVAADACRQ